MEENEEYGLPDVEMNPIDRGSQGNPQTSQSNQNKKKNERKKDSKAPMIVTFVVIFIAILVGLWFFVIGPNMEKAEQRKLAEAEQARIEQEAADKKAEEEAEQARLAEEAEQQRLAEEAAAEAEPEVGTVTVLSAKTGRSYVVIGSFFDEDMAHDAGNKLAGEGVSTFILEPVGDVKFYRLAVADFDSYGEASTSVDNYKGTYGEEIWALKY